MNVYMEATPKITEREKLINNMLAKSQSSFLLAIELFNKPTIDLNTEGFVIFICNAWELLFKAYLISKKKTIYFTRSGKRTNVSYSLSYMISKIMTNDKDPARINLEIVSGIRNKATHLIIPEYSTAFHGIFLSCCKNYVSKLNQYFSININEKFKTDFLSLTIPTSSSSIDVVGKYGKTISNQFNALSKFVDKTLMSNASNGTIPASLSLTYNITFKSVSKIEDANLTMSKYKKNPDIEYVEVEKPVDPAETHPLNRKKILDLICNELTTSGIEFTPYTLSGNKNFTSDTFNLYVNANKIKTNKTYTYAHEIGKTTQYTYSVKLVEKIVNDITNDPDIFVKYKNKKN